MPRFRSSDNYVKVWRPEGTLYSEAKVRWMLPSLRDKDPVGDALVIGQAAEGAVRAFLAEFGRMPAPERTVVEIACSSTGANASCLELPEEP